MKTPTFPILSSFVIVHSRKETNLNQSILEFFRLAGDTFYFDATSTDGKHLYSASHCMCREWGIDELYDYTCTQDSDQSFSYSGGKFMFVGLRPLQ